MTRLRWENLTDAEFEILVGVLLSRLHPESQRIDGQGGDGGRDVELQIEGKLELFEAKFFPDRVSKEKGRRKQVERSLARAATRKPDRWSLVVPVDPTPGELTWFEGLRCKYPFPLEWKGRIWLESHLADHPSVVRFYFADGYQEATRALAELDKEQALLAGGIPDVMERLRVLRSRMDESDPHYRLDIRLEGQSTTIAIVPRYPGAERDRPITIRGAFNFPATPEGTDAAHRFREALDFGEQTVIPGEFIDTIRVEGLPGVEELPSSQLVIGPADIEQEVDVAGRVFVQTPDGVALGSLPVRFQERRRGMRGGILAGSDATGMVNVDIRFGLDPGSTARVNLSFSQPPAATPGMVLPALRVLQHMTAPNTARVELSGHTLGEPMVLPESDLVPRSMVELIEDLDRIQAYSRTSFAIPDEFTSADVSAIRQATRLIAGETVVIGSGPIKASIVPHSLEKIRSILQEGSAYAFAFGVKDHSVTIAGVDIPLGPAMASIRAARVQALSADQKAASDALAVELHPIDGAQIELRLGESAPPGLDIASEDAEGDT